MGHPAATASQGHFTLDAGTVTLAIGALVIAVILLELAQLGVAYHTWRAGRRQ